MYDFSGFLEGALECINNYYTTLFGMFVEMTMRSVVMFRCLPQQCLWQLSHLRGKASDGHNQPAPPPPFVRR